MCAKRKVAGDVGVFLQGEWFCCEKCRHGGRGLKTIDELVDLLREAFSERPDVILRIKESILRTLESL